MKLLLKNINELAAKQKSEGLTAFEKERQATLRQEYLKKIRGTVQDNLHHVTIIDPLGDDVTPKKLKEIQAELRG
ncbi:DUF896 domain-containing protein [Listeria monocytogenes]|uniref:DUF896 domain-containing protein n=1 Tax=Listeria welshimeri TaxID=1643 RepID=UPI0010D29D6C|nr:DUF896 domain-containing protein [Listeria welshimeri]EAD6901983.1 DUF896 domain-containing protein [Listeria monocytogenes]MBF2509832.1 DUF896 domain-containing protein [Listeria welshimeri]MBF2698431.1 DUF896 domain-containing protein [Listeria welshimeri]HAA8741694.1 DUF896 domain-containing protein [Listeria monocytogenes]HAB0263816.1 DUF896 domain-containing protein [Listeria monocytogenes]